MPTAAVDAESRITAWLARWAGGEQDAAEEVFRRLYGQLRAIARSRLRTHGGASLLSATELVHEAYLRLHSQPKLPFESRAHFLGIVARVVRNVLVDDARQRGSLKRGGGARQLHLSEAEPVAAGCGHDALSVNEALTLLEQIDSRQARLVELRFFAGLTIEQSAELLGVSSATAARLWRRARAWLVTAVQAPRGGGR